jgi:hypothetical protein
VYRRWQFFVSSACAEAIMLIAPPRVHEATVPAAHPLLNNTVLAFTDCGEVLLRVPPWGTHPLGVLQAGTRVPLKLKYPTGLTNTVLAFTDCGEVTAAYHRLLPSAASRPRPHHATHTLPRRSWRSTQCSARLTEAPVRLRIGDG